MARQSKSKSKSLCKPEPSDDTCQSEPIVKRMVVAGVVSIEDTGQGVPGLVVEIHHIGQSPVRLSSTVTGSAGRFSVTITEDQIKNLSLHNLHIQLLVLTAEKPGLVRADRILFESDVRENAALSELFQIEIPVDLLVKKGLQRTVDNARPLAERRAEALAEASKATRIVSEEAKKRTEVEIDKAKEHRRFFNDVVAPSVLREISTVSEREQVNPRFVADENEVFTRSAKAQHDELVKLNEEEKDSAGITVKKVRRHTRIQLEADVLRRLGMDQPTSDTKRVTQEQLEAALGLPLDKRKRSSNPV